MILQDHAQSTFNSGVVSWDVKNADGAPGGPAHRTRSTPQESGRADATCLWQGGGSGTERCGLNCQLIRERAAALSPPRHRSEEGFILCRTSARRPHHVLVRGPADTPGVIAAGSRATARAAGPARRIFAAVDRAMEPVPTPRGRAVRCGRRKSTRARRWKASGSEEACCGAVASRGRSSTVDTTAALSITALQHRRGGRPPLPHRSKPARRCWRRPLSGTQT